MQNERKKQNGQELQVLFFFFQILSSLSRFTRVSFFYDEKRDIAGTKKSRSKKRALLDPSFKTNKRVKRVIDEKIEGLVASKVKLTGKRFIFGDLNDKASKTLKGIHLKRGKKELKKKRRFTMAEKIEAELAALRRGD